MRCPSGKTGSKFLMWATCAVLAGCPVGDGPTYPSVSRDCAGFENPGANQWMPVATNDAQSFVNSSGEVRSLHVIDIKVDPAYRETAHAPTPADVVCLRELTVTLEHTGGSISTEWQFTNIEYRQDQPVAEQRLTLTVKTRVMEQTPPPYPPSYAFALENLADTFNVSVESSGVSHTYRPTQTINGVAYSDVLEASIRRDDSRYSPLSLPEADWVRIVIARGAGLVQYELRNGQIFTRQ